VVHGPGTVSRSIEVILHSRLVGGRWSEPEVALFSGRFRDVAVALAPDGTKLFFVSNRAADGSGPKGDFDIWEVDRDGAGWGAPHVLPAPVNSPAQEYGVSVAASGNLYFASSRPGGKGGYDLYRSRLVGGVYPEPENL